MNVVGVEPTLPSVVAVPGYVQIVRPSWEYIVQVLYRTNFPVLD